MSSNIYNNKNVNGIPQLFILPLFSDITAKKLEGKFLNEEEFNLIVNQDCDVWIPDSENNWQTLFHFRKNVLNQKHHHLILDTFKEPAKKASSYRGMATGPLVPEKVSKNVKRVLSPGRYKSQVEYKNGQVSNYRVANNVNSIIVGYYDKPKISERSTVLKENLIPCRATKFTNDNWNKWEKTIPFFTELNHWYKDLAPNIWNYQKNIADLTPDFRINNTVFTTVTINYNWRTACHKDSGDLQDALSAFAVVEEKNDKGESFEGGYLTYPQYGLAINVREGDFLLINPHEYHCNTEMDDKNGTTSRLSFVCYYRQGIVKCQNKS